MRFSIALVLALAVTGVLTTADATTWHVPSECPTIQAGVDSAAVGDTVLVDCGTYYEHDIVMKSGVCLMSETGESGCVTIDAGHMGRVIYCLNVDAAASIVGFTITGGLATGTATEDSTGGGVYCEDSSPTLANCAFLENHADLAGGGLSCGTDPGLALAGRKLRRADDLSSPPRSGPTITDCTFSGNSSRGGGAAFFGLASSTVTGCTFSGNTGSIDLTASNVFGNGGGDWTDCIAAQFGVDGNFSADPLFCDAQLGDLTLYLNSPCLPGNHPNGGDWGLIGARGAGCPATGIAESTCETSWGSIKAMFR